MAKWLKFDHVEATVMEALEMLNELVDESDPDIDLPNIIHAFQTAEQIRAKHPDKEWFHLVGLIHDLGKVFFSHFIDIFTILNNCTVFENHPKCRIIIFEFLHFPPIFDLLKLTCLVTLFDRKL